MIIPVMIGVILIVFTISYFMPGDPVEALLGTDYTQEEYDAKAEQIGLTGGYFEQLGRMFNNLIHGDLGVSYMTLRPITQILTAPGQGGSRLWVSIKLGLMSCILTCLIAIPIGIICAVKQNSPLDYGITTLSIFIASMPGFWVALMLIILFCQKLQWLPVSGLSSWKGYILPVLCNALSPLAVTSRMTRSSMLEVIRQDYVRTARSKGLKERKVIMGHALKNALIPVITVVGAQFSMVIGGSVIIESIFNIQGMGALLVTAIGNRDYSEIIGVTIILSAFTMVMMLVVDLVYAAVDPRIKAEFSKNSKKRKKASKQPEGSVA